MTQHELKLLLEEPTKRVVKMEILLTSLKYYIQFATETMMEVYLSSRTSKSC